MHTEVLRRRTSVKTSNDEGRPLCDPISHKGKATMSIGS